MPNTGKGNLLIRYTGRKARGYSCPCFNMIKLEYQFKLISKDNEKIRNKQGMYFLSKKFKDFEKLVKLTTVSQYKGNILTETLTLTITAYFKSKVHADCFNLPKGICDALEGIAYKNDRQIKFGSIIIGSESSDTDHFVVEIGLFIPPEK